MDIVHGFRAAETGIFASQVFVFVFAEFWLDWRDYGT